MIIKTRGLALIDLQLQTKPEYNMNEWINWGISDHQLLDFEQKVEERKYLLLEGVTIGQMGLINPHNLEAKESFLFLLNELEALIPIEIKQQLIQRSALSFSLYFAQIMAWWLPQHHKMYLLRAFALISQKHRVEIKLRWNLARKKYQMPIQKMDISTWMKLIASAISIAFLFYLLGLNLPIWLIVLSFIALFYRFSPKVYQCPDPDCAVVVNKDHAQCSNCGLKLYLKNQMKE